MTRAGPGWPEQPLLDLSAIDLEAAGRVTYLLHQQFRYDYDEPVRDLRQRLVGVPRRQHGALRRRAHLISVSQHTARSTARADRHGNLVTRVRVPAVEESVEFTMAALVDREGPAADDTMPAAALADPRHLRPTRLTQADQPLRELAAELRAATRGDAVAFAEACCDRLRAGMTFALDATSVATTAAQAYATARGVCQDFAHITIALCRAAAMPARYVSGHLLGEPGGSHAWVEVLVPDGQDGQDGHRARAFGIDPTNGCRAGPRHLPVAVGRDYTDVAPTSGVYSGTARGRLTSTKRVGIAAVDQQPQRHRLAG
jgi:transglutaminase-like putative cysteine protease